MTAILDASERFPADAAAAGARRLQLAVIDAEWLPLLAEVRAEREAAIAAAIKASGTRLEPVLDRVTVTDTGAIEGGALQATIAVRSLIGELPVVAAQLEEIRRRYAVILAEHEETWANARAPYDFVLTPPSEHRNQVAS
jgi:hypothetical protein